MPWPISALHIITVTLLSDETLTQPLSGTCVPSTGNGVEPTRRWRGGSADHPTTSAPAAPATLRLPIRKVLRVSMRGFRADRPSSISPVAALARVYRPSIEERARLRAI